MKPNFALSLSFDGIGLLHRTAADHWHLMGEVALDSPDLSTELATLREKAAALEPSGVTTKLVIPDAQIRYLDLPAGNAPDADHEAAAMRALDGVTPYALDDLAFDWNVVGTRLHVAAVARETLREAESFAREHDFNPVSFVARPGAGDFGTEPFFGETAQAVARVTRDGAPIEIAGATRAPQSQAVASGDDDRAQAPVAAASTPVQAGAKGEGNAGGTPAVSSIRAARDVPERGAPQLAGAERALPDEAGQGASSIPDLVARPDGPEAVPSPAPAAASLAPRRTEPGRGAAPSGSRLQGDREDKAARKDSPSLRAAEPKAPEPNSAEDEAERLTIFGARESQHRPRGKPRFLGLILTVLLVLVMAGVAAWATIFPNSDIARLVQWSEPRVAVTPESPDGRASEPGSPGSDEGAEPPAQENQPVSDSAEIVAPAPDDAPDAPEETEPSTPETVQTLDAESWVWQMPPDVPPQPDADNLDNFYLTSIDEDLPVGDAVALPDVERSPDDTRPETPAAPAPPGTTFEFDARGLVVPTPEGALTPDGVEVRAGPPPVQPPETPARTLDVPGLTLSPEIAEEIERISDIRPRTRPENLIERQERGALGGRSRPELAGFRPRIRPVEERQTTDVAGVPGADAVDAALAEAADTSVGPDEQARSEAVTASLKPQTRPGNLRTAVRRAAPQSQEQPQAAAPRVPSSASVARAATARNAVNLRQVNLIGVYGSPSNRRALVRLSNGSYQKVKVGDRLDGGRVSAIGSGEVRYSKRGQPVVLRMPSG